MQKKNDPKLQDWVEWSETFEPKDHMERLVSEQVYEREAAMALIELKRSTEEAIQDSILAYKNMNKAAATRARVRLNKARKLGIYVRERLLAIIKL